MFIISLFSTLLFLSIKISFISLISSLLILVYWGIIFLTFYKYLLLLETIDSVMTVSYLLILFEITNTLSSESSWILVLLISLEIIDSVVSVSELFVWFAVYVVSFSLLFSKFSTLLSTFKLLSSSFLFTGSPFSLNFISNTNVLYHYSYKFVFFILHFIWCNLALHAFVDLCFKIFLAI